MTLKKTSLISKIENWDYDWFVISSRDPVENEFCSIKAEMFYCYNHDDRTIHVLEIRLLLKPHRYIQEFEKEFHLANVDYPFACKFRTSVKVEMKVGGLTFSCRLPFNYYIPEDHPDTKVVVVGDDHYISATDSIVEGKRTDDSVIIDGMFHLEGLKPWPTKKTFMGMQNAPVYSVHPVGNFDTIDGSYETGRHKESEVPDHN